MMGYGMYLFFQYSFLGETLRIAASHKIFDPGETTMTDITLRRQATPEFTSLVDLLKELFSATPLGLMLAAFATKR